MNSSSHNGHLEKEVGKWKAVSIILGVMLLIILTSGFSYFLGTKSNGESEVDITPSPTLDDVSNFFEEITADGPTPTPSVLSGVGLDKSKASINASPTPTTLTKKLILKAIPRLDGFRASNGSGKYSSDIRVGRNEAAVTRGFVSFDLSDIPESATIHEVILRLYQTKTVGDPYDAGNPIEVDHLTYGDSLDETDYAMAALVSSFAAVSSNKRLEWKEVDVTKRLKDDISNARSMSQFRIHFETENTGNDTTGDFSYFESADNSEGTGNIPELVVKYAQ